MIHRSFTELKTKRAPALTGAVLYLFLALGITACGEKDGTPDWNKPGGSSLIVSAEERTAPAAAEPELAEPEVQDEVPQETNAAPATESLRFIAYNVENWLTIDRYVDHVNLKDAPKPDSEKKAVVQLLSNAKPDVIGLCEIGEAADLAEIQQSLKAAGLDLPHSHYAGGADPVRHLGLLSRHPITSTAKPAEMDYQMDGKTFGFNRGVLDATVQAKGKSYRFLGVHLKSKREVEEGDQEQMRIHEARLLRRHVDSILKADAEARLIVYGDFNDTRPSKAFKTITGSYNDPGYLTAVPFKDSRGEAWTHHWAPHDIYSRIDYVTVTRALRRELDFKNSHIIDDPMWSSASDHRALLTIFR
jgi:endonuclease/exonuclease/phosphatase family metal-dependent hydrolase